MKSNDLKNILQRITDILDMYPNKDIEYILNDIKKLKENNGNEKQRKEGSEKSASSKINDVEQRALIDAFFNNIASLTMVELEKKLNSSELFPTLEYLRYFSRKIGVSLASRQSKANLIHTIKSYIDRMRIDKTISKRNE